MNYNLYKIKKNIDIDKNKISNSKIDYLYNLGLKNGALGGKLLGAGGGGFLLFFVESDKKKFFIKKMNKYISLPIEFNDKGSEIILNS